MLFSLHNYSIKVNCPENFPDGEWNVAGNVIACFILLDLAAYCLRTKRCLTLSVKYCCYTLRWCHKCEATTIFNATHHLKIVANCFEWLRHCSNIAALCCAKNRRCESSPRVTSPLDQFRKAVEKYFGILYCLLHGKRWIYPSKYVAE